MSAHCEFTMPKRFLAAVLVVACGAASSGQTRTGVSRTPWGHPDLQGRWTNATVTLVERPVEFGAKEFFTADEAAEYSKTALERFLAANNFTTEAAISGEFVPGIWVEERDIVASRRTSLIVGPTGRVPALTFAARARLDARNLQRKQTPDATPRWTALRVRVPRGESRAGEHPQRRSSDGTNSVMSGFSRTS